MAKATSPIRAFSHVGMCVSELERSLRFYCDGLGFELWASFTLGNEVGPSNEMENAGDIVLQSRFLRRDGAIIEILHYDKPGYQGVRTRRPMNQLGVTHLSLLVDDVDAVAATIREYGGAVLENTRSKRKDAQGLDQDFLFCTDPDGLRIELMYLPGAGWDEALAQSRRL